MFAIPENTLWLVLFIVFSTVSLIQLVYYILFYSRILYRKTEKKRGKKEAVSVIVCARNEVDNLLLNLPTLLVQDYPDYELIVVNDCSEDNSEDILKLFEQQYDHLKVVTIHKETSLAHSKKMALFVGIKAAKNELLLLSDADCATTSPQWINSMVSGFRKNTDFVLGYGAYLREKGLLNKYIRFDTMFIAMQYMGMAIAGAPYMGVGRNLAYRRSIFFENRGFGKHLNLQSGDDDLFINELARANNTSVVMDSDSFTRSIPAKSFSEFSKQKTRHLSTSSYYRSLSRFLLILEPFSRVLFYTLGIVIACFSGSWQLSLSILFVTLLFKMVIFGKAQIALKEKDLLLLSLVFDILSPFINLWFLFKSRRNRHRNYEWK